MAKIAVIAMCALLHCAMSFADPTAALLKENALALLDVRNDEMEVDITITSLRVWKQRPPRPDVSVSDVALRVWVNKRTKLIRAQVVYLASYRSQEAWSINSANYQTPEGPAAAETTRIDFKVSGCSQFSGCYYDEQVGFNVPWQVLRHYAEQYTPEKRQDWWRVRMRPRSAEEPIDIGIPLGEVAAVVERAEALSKN
jgi:hypothetical protein